MRIVIDLLGGDTSPQEFLSFLQDFGIEEQLQLDLFVKNDTQPVNIPHISLSLIPVSEVITMEDDPTKSIRQKKESSLILGIEKIKNKEVDAFLSTGNTGALIAASKIYLPTFPSISRPALLALIPTKKHPLAVIDVGANVSCKPDQLVEFARLGIAFQKSLGIKDPKLALLNIGVEKQKGRQESRQAYSKLQQFPEFVGNIEGREVFEGKIHVLVTDGFSGNIFLKTAEGVSSFILDQLLKFSPQGLGKIKKELNYKEYPGAMIAGIDGFVIKCHGNASPYSIASTLQKMIALLKLDFVSSIKKTLI